MACFKHKDTTTVFTHPADKLQTCPTFCKALGMKHALVIEYYRAVLSLTKFSHAFWEASGS